MRTRSVPALHPGLLLKKVIEGKDKIKLLGGITRGRLENTRDKKSLLLLEAETWSAWSDFRRGGPLPAHPPAPVMLRRMAAAAYRLAALAERQAAASR